jgi:hypothetical protein
MASRHFSRRLDGRRRVRAGAIRHKRDATRVSSLNKENGKHFVPECFENTRLDEILDKDGVDSLCGYEQLVSSINVVRNRVVDIKKRNPQLRSPILQEPSSCLNETICDREHGSQIQNRRYMVFGYSSFTAYH